MSALQPISVIDKLAEKIKDSKKVMLEIPLHTKGEDFTLNIEGITLVLSGEGIIVRNYPNFSKEQSTLEFDDDATPFIIYGSATIYPDEDTEVSYKEIPADLLSDEELFIISKLCT